MLNFRMRIDYQDRSGQTGNTRLPTLRHTGSRGANRYYYVSWGIWASLETKPQRKTLYAVLAKPERLVKSNAKHAARQISKVRQNPGHEAGIPELSMSRW